MFKFLLVLVAVMGLSQAAHAADAAAPPETVVTCEDTKKLSADLLFTQQERDAFKRRAEQCEEREKKAAASPAPTTGVSSGFVPQRQVVCEDPAEKVGGECRCPEGWFETIHTERYVNTTRVRINCSVTKAELDRLLKQIRDKVDAICGNPNATPEDCARARGQEEVIDTRTGELPVDLNALKATDASLDERIKRLADRVAELERKDQEENCKKNGDNCPDFSSSRISDEVVSAMFLDVEGVARPGPGPEGLNLRLNFKIDVYGRPDEEGPARCGFGARGGAGYSLNSDFNRHSVMAGVGLVCDTTDALDRSTAFGLRLEYRAEPTLGPNDTHALLGVIGFDGTFGDSVVYWGVNGGVGGGVYARYEDGERTNERSDFALLALVNAALGFQF